MLAAAASWGLQVRAACAYNKHQQAARLARRSGAARLRARRVQQARRCRGLGCAVAAWGAADGSGSERLRLLTK